MERNERGFPPQGEEALREMEERLRSVCATTGAIAHDVKNLMTAILGYSELMLRRMAEDDPLRRHVQEITAAAERAAAMTRQLLTQTSRR